MAVADKIFENLPRGGIHVKRYAFMNFAVLDDLGGDGKIAIAGIRRGADIGLVDFLSLRFADRDDISGAGGHGDERFKRGEVDLLRDIVVGAWVGCQFRPVVFALLRTQKAANLGVGGKYGRRGAQFRAHVGDHMAVHGGKTFQARTVILDDAPYPAIDAMAAEHFENDILGAHPVGEPADKLDAPDEGHVEPERLAGHGERDFDAARADRQHADRTGRRGVTVRAEQSLSGFAETFLMDRMADSIAGTAEPNSETPAGGLNADLGIWLH